MSARFDHPRAKGRSFFVGLSAALLVAGCVSSGAGYDDVRELTSARLGKPVPSHEREGRQSIDAESRRLLAAPLTPDGAARIALLNSPALQAAFESIGVARGNLRHALRLPNPSLGAAVRFGHDSPEIELDATLDLTDLLLLAFRPGAARAEVDAAALEVAGRAVDLAFAVRSAFFDYQAAAEGLELERSVLASLHASADMAQRLHEAGNVTDLVLASERAFYEEARLAFSRSEARVAAERERLNALMGIWGRGAAGWRASPKLPDAERVESLLSDLERRAVARSLELELLRKRFDSAERRADVARVEGWVPELRAGVSAERGDGEWGIGPLAEVEVPLFYQGQGEASAAEAEMRRERKLFADTAVRIRANARALAKRLAVAAEGVEYYRSTLLPLRAQVLEQTLLEYNAMSAGVFQLLQAKRDQMASAQAYLKQLHEYWTLRTEVEQLLAGRLRSEGVARDESTPEGAPARGDSGGH